MSHQRIKVGFFGDSELILESLSNVLKRQRDMVCVVVTPTSNWTYQPDVLLIDWQDANESSLRPLSIKMPNTKLLVINADKGVLDIVGCIRHGVQGFVLKSAKWGDAVNVIRKVALGDRVFPEEVAIRLFDQIREAQSLSRTGTHDLTAKERAILRLIAAGLSNQEIADKQGLAIATIKSHLQRIFSKTNCRNRAEVTAFFVKAVGKRWGDDS